MDRSSTQLQYATSVLQNTSKISASQLSVLRTSLREQVERQKLYHRFSGNEKRVCNSPFHLQAEFDTAHGARQAKRLLEKIKRVLRKERQRRQPF